MLIVWCPHSGGCRGNVSSSKTRSVKTKATTQTTREPGAGKHLLNQFYPLLDCSPGCGIVIDEESSMVIGEVTRHRSGSSVQGVTRGAERSRASNEGYRWFTISEKAPTRIGSSP